MYLFNSLCKAVALSGFITYSFAADIECPDGKTIVQKTPVEIISYDPTTTHTSYITITRFIIIPPSIPPETTSVNHQTTGSPFIITTTVPYNRSTPWTGTTPSSTTVPGTVIVYIPSTSISPVTTTTPWTGSVTSTTTVPGTGTVLNSVIVYVPSTSVPPVTTTTPWTGTGTSTSTIPGTGTVPNSVIIYVPNTSVPSIPPVTTTTPWTGSTPSTTTVPGTGTVPNSVLVYVPSSSSTPTPSSTLSSSSSTISTSSSTTPVPSGACIATVGASCSASGLTLQLYANNASYISGYGVTGSTDQGVGPDYYLSQEPLDQGSSPSLSVPASYPPYDQPSSQPYQVEGHTSFNYYGGYTQTYGGITYDANNFTLVFTGYYLPTQSGSYTFCAHADNRDAFYIGSDTAFPCGDASNAATPAGATPLAEYFFDKTDGDNVCQSIDLVAGFYYPVRSVYGNWGPPSSLDLTVQPPGGEASSDVTGSAFPNTCNASA